MEMTREEKVEKAIKIIRNTSDLGYGIVIEGDTKKINEALDFAVYTMQWYQRMQPKTEQKFCSNCEADHKQEYIKKSDVQFIMANLLNGYLVYEDRKKIEEADAEIENLPTVTK